jgi:hypothetical protein
LGGDASFHAKGARRDYRDSRICPR